ncbi:hypothetical protein [Archangium lipolyticum]|uniref:hypothetical protein n=1 Tax=Archangium lipolyticum TaxID=2970465 RepID=UPI00214A7DD5|nr:hypothetical protein [Archangium lipolyticum]
MTASIEPRRILGMAMLLAGISACSDFDDALGEWHRRHLENPQDEQPVVDSHCNGMAGAGLFVDPVNGSDAPGNPGSPDAPLRTVREALQRLRSGQVHGKVAIYLASGSFDEAALTLDVPVSLCGGYGGVNDWVHREGQRSRLAGGTVGLTVRDLPDAGIVLKDVSIHSANGVAPSEPSIALRVLRSSGVELRHVVLEAGLGAPGADGGSGTPGQGGANGGNGSDAYDTIPGSGGQAGTTACAGSDRSGGAGGSGVTAGNGYAGSPGKPDTRGGAEGSGDSDIICGSDVEYCNCNGYPGGNGTPGAMGAKGLSGAVGSGLGTLDLLGGVWIPNQQGGNGNAGHPGEGGGGGGGGGSSDGYNPFFTPAAGGGGGGGGGGGCGGTGGQGGGGGGASISLLLVDSRVTVGEGTQLHVLGGGPGGSGGAGGEGGLGGLGGTGGTGGFEIISEEQTPIAKTIYSTGGSGGKGGKGGKGGGGGAGGGGGGGPSVGVWCGPNAGFVSSTTLSEQGIGPGGAGGTSPSGNAGAAGSRLLTYGCPVSP